MRPWITILLVSLFASVAAASPRKGIVIDKAKVSREHKEALRALERDYSPQALADKHALLLRGHTGYVYGDAGSAAFALRQVNDLAEQAGAKKVDATLAKRVARSGSLVSLQHSMRDASIKRNDRLAHVLLPLALDHAIESAIDLGMSPAETTKMLGAYGFSLHDVERHSKYKIPR